MRTDDPVHHPVNALSFSKGLLVAGTTAGLLALRLNTEAAREPEPQVNDG